MENLLNNQVLKVQGLNQQAVLNENEIVAVSELDLEFEHEIGNGNLQDYLAIYGELADN